MARPRPCPDRCTVLLLGGGGREHALAWKLVQSPRLERLWLTNPQNAGLSALGEPCPPEILTRGSFHFDRWCDQVGIDLVIVGPEGPLADGIADQLATDRRLVFGPSANAAQLEADKAFAKEVMRQAAVPTAEARVFERVEAAREYLEAHDEPCVIKASGLCAGKGVYVCETPAEAQEAIDQLMITRVFGDAGGRVIIEEKLIGQELSVLALVDGRTIWLLDPAQDHKQVHEGDRGPNTGGMGAYCPTPLVDHATLKVIESEIFVPIVDALRRDGIEYRGVLYAGLMLTAGGPKVLEFNCRFGDPECQPLMTRLQGDLVEIAWATAAGNLDAQTIDFDPRVSCCVVMCSEGYPGPYEKGKVITGIEAAEALGGPDESVKVFHAGTTRTSDGDLVTSGGRVLGVTALAATLAAARDLANAACAEIHFEGSFHRHDIGDRVLAATETPTNH
ncbi:MAG: phosphoribosylamine--glycine ligase [Phycisphaerales bacterium]|nr:phosphoribosylamine--glycine ligase [Phycisphaerae bacterium]NNF42402.1 phosphoribosylamine--glycine ligase [Phycisphaerales bacterium]NNM26165.1 phosphoribosylamine--glycine ligase [Phycisphaerales bacterium]